MARAIRTLTVTQALENRKAPAANWASIAGEFDAEVLPRLQPGFKVGAGDLVFTIGSCFARNIEENLASLGCRVPMLEFRLPPDEWHGRANGALNRFTPPSFRQTIEWVIAISERGGVVEWERDCAPIALDWGDGGVYDLDLVSAAPVSRDRFLERRQHVYDILSSVLVADCLMMTPGLVEAWFDTETGLYIQSAPTHRRMLAVRDRFRFEVLSFEQSYDDLAATIDLVRARNPKVKVLITASPVPLTTTFTGQDIRVANTYSKSVLRAACGQVAALREQVDYFPSFESATLSAESSEVWMEDRQHVSPGFIGKIIGHLSEAYFEGVDQADTLSQQARTALDAGDAAQAAVLAGRALEQRSDHAECRSVLIDALLAQEQWADAEAHLRFMLRDSPDDPALLYRLARAVLRQGKDRLDEVLDLCRAYAAMPTANLGSMSWAIRFLSRHGQGADDAEALARGLIERLPLTGQAYQPLIELYTEAGREAEAVAVLEAAVKTPRPMAQHRAQLDRLRTQSPPSAP